MKNQPDTENSSQNHSIVQTIKTKKRLIIALVVIMSMVFIATVIAQNNRNANEQRQENQTVQDDNAEPLVSEESADYNTSEPINPSKLSEVVADPEAFSRSEVTVNGRIETVLEKRIFRLSDTETNDALYVVTPRELSDDERDQIKDSLDGTNTATVTGTVRTFNETDLQDSLGITLPEDLKELFSKKHIFIIVKSFTVNTE